MSNHLKSFNAPKSWTIPRKVHKWVIRPAAGAHPLERALPVALLIKQLGLAKTSREVKKILNEKAVKVDGKVVTEPHFGVGFMDIVQIGQTALRCSLDQKGRLKFIEAPTAETGKKICTITDKHSIKGNKIQLNLSSGRNIIVSKNEYATGDSLVIDLPGQKISAHYPLAKGHTAFMISGKHIGQLGVIDNIEGNRLWFTKGKEKFETLKQFAFVVGKEKPAVKL